MNDLSFPEKLTSEMFIDQTDEQLNFTFKRLTENKALFDVVEYMITSQDGLGFMVKKDFYEMSLISELHYRDLL